MTRGGWALWFVLMAYVTFALWMGERDSCRRQSAREGTRIIAAAAWDARLTDAEEADRRGDHADAEKFRRLADKYLQAWRESAPLDCGGLPDATVPESKGTPPRAP